MGGEKLPFNPLGFFSSTINTLVSESSNSKGPRGSGCCYDGWFEGIGQFSFTLPRSVGLATHSVEDGSAHTPHDP